MSTRYGLSVKLDMDNAAFDDGNRAAEAARILRHLADKIEGGEYERTALGDRFKVSGYLWDVNGNSCGSWEAKPRRLRD